MKYLTGGPKILKSFSSTCWFEGISIHLPSKYLHDYGNPNRAPASCSGALGASVAQQDRTRPMAWEGATGEVCWKFLGFLWMMYVYVFLLYVYGFSLITMDYFGYFCGFLWIAMHSSWDDGSSRRPRSSGLVSLSLVPDESGLSKKYVNGGGVHKWRYPKIDGL